MNSYEYGVSASLFIPRVLFPRLGKKDYDFPASTTFNMYADQLNRARFFKILAFGGMQRMCLTLRVRASILSFRLN
jgi:hypothetical protein